MAAPGPTIFNDVVTYVPSCSGVKPSSASSAAANSFDPTSTSYYLDQFPSMVPGIVLAGISLVCCVLMFCWVCVRFCRRRKIAAAGQEAEKEQFIASDGEASCSTPPPAPPPTLGRRQKASNWLTASMLLFAVACVGCAAWGMGKSIQATNHTIPGFWDVVHELESLVVNGANSFYKMSAGLNATGVAVTSLADQADVLVPALERLNVSVNITDELMTELQAVPQYMDVLGNLSETIMVVAVPVLNESIRGAINDVLDLEDPTMDISNTWRYIVFAVLFGLIILFVIVATAACWYMRFGRWASLLVALVWLLSVIVNCVGLGLLTGIKDVSEDACLYTETFTFNNVLWKINDPSVRSVITLGLEYYYGLLPNATLAALDDLSPEAAAELTMLLLDRRGNSTFNFTALMYEAQDLNASLHTVVGNDKYEFAQRLVGAGLPNASAMALVQLEEGLVQFLDGTYDVARGLSRYNVIPLYHLIKSYLCCGIYNTVDDVWVPWVVTGVLLIVYCLLASARIVWQTIYPQDKAWTGLWSRSVHQQPAAGIGAPPVGALDEPPPVADGGADMREGKAPAADGLGKPTLDSVEK